MILITFLVISARKNPAEAMQREDPAAAPPRPGEPCECDEDEDGRDDPEEDCHHTQPDPPHNPQDHHKDRFNAHGPDDADHDADPDHNAD
jgi:hypothetical protein